MRLIWLRACTDHGPGGVELHIGLPVFQRLARLADFFVGQRQIVMRVGVRRGELQGSLVGLDCFLHAAGFVEHIAQIEVRERVARIGFDGLAVVLLGEHEILAIVIERSQIDVRRRVVGLDFENLMIRGDGVRLGAGIFFQSECRAKTMP